MDILYYNNQVKEELDGAMEYIKKAIDIKKEHPNWAQIYQKMSMAELEHASNLMKMFEEDYKACVADMEAKGHSPLYLTDCRASIMDMHQEFSSKVNYMHELYNKA
jgi:rubrerythrin